MKKISIRRRFAALAAIAALAALFAGVAVTPSVAATPPSTNSTPASTGPSSDIPITVNVTGLVGVLLAPVLNPLLTSVVNPLVSGLGNLPNAVVAPLLVTLVGGSNSATTPGATISATEIPLTSATTCTAGSTTCYRQVTAGLNVPGVLQLGAGLVQGTTQRVAVAPSFDRLIAKSRIADVSLGGILGLIDILKVGAIESTAQCSGTAAAVVPAGTASTAGVTLLGISGGQPVVSVDVATAGGAAALTVKVLGVSLPVGGTIPINLPGLKAVAVLNGNLLNLSVEVSLSSLLTGLGLGALGASISNLADVKATVNIVVGSGVTTTATTSQAVGLNVGIGLALDANINLQGLAGVQIKTGGVPTSNVLDLKLANSNCSATGGSLTPTTWILPGLT